MRRPSHATIVAYLALFVALGGTAAVALPGNNSVDSGDIKNNAVCGKDVDEKSLKGVLSCPGKMRGRAGVCFDRSLQTATDWDSAHRACADRRLRLPTLGEGLLMVGGLPRDSTFHWVDIGDTNNNSYLAANEIGFGPNMSVDARTNPHVYRCVTDPRD